MSRFLLTIGSFAVIVGMYVLYDRFAVPMLLPERTSRVYVDPEPQHEELTPYFPLFSEDSWERDPTANIQILEIDQTVILFRNETVSGNFIKLEPCTIIFLDKNEALSDEERIRQAFVMKTLQYAEIEFDGEVNFSRVPFPKIKGGKLIGKVSIHSDMKESGPQDDFHIDTENVVFTDSPATTTISTLKDVAFRWGAHSGEGSVLNIELNRDPKNKKASKELTLLRFDSLKRLNMILSDKDDPVVATVPKTPGVSEATKATTTSQGAATQLDVNCRREFVFVPGKTRGDWLVGFFGDVLAIRTTPDGNADRITGEELQILFSPKTPDSKAKSPDPKAKAATPPSNNVAGLGAMEPILLMVHGKMGINNQRPVPAQLTSKQSGGLVMVGDQIQYDLRKNQLLIETEKTAGASEAVFLYVQDNRYVFRSSQGFLYTLNPEGGIGRLVSASPGGLQGVLGEDDQIKKVSAAWSSLQMEPYKFDPKQMVVQMGGGVRFEMEGFGKMTADKFDLLCRVSQESPASQPGKTPDSSLFGGTGTITPDRATALGKVHFENENGTCDVGQMDIVFETVKPDGTVERSRWTPQILCELPPEFLHRLPGAGKNSNIVQVQYREPREFGTPPQPRPAVPHGPVANQGTLPPVTTPAPAAKPETTKPDGSDFLGFRSGTSRSLYAITGNRMKMLVRNEGGRSEASIIHLEGNVRVLEKLLSPTAGDPVEILGEELSFWYPSTPNTQIQIKGKAPKDAEFRGKGVKLNSMEINISRARNLIWSEGAGRLLANAPPQGNAQPGVGVNQGNTRPNTAPLVSFGTTKPGGDNRLVVDWNDWMSFDGKTLVFLGKPDLSGIRVRAVYQNTKIVADAMMVHLNRLVSFFDDHSNVEAKTEFIDCTGNVAIRTEEIDNTLTKSLNIGEFVSVRVYVESGYFVADGPGCIRSTSRSNGKGFTLPGGAPVRSAVPTTGDELTHLYVRFHRNVSGNFLTNVVEITGIDHCMYSPVKSWDAKFGVEDLNNVTKRGYVMNCEKLEIVQMPNPIGATQSIELTATGGAKIEGPNNLFAGAEKIKYNQAKSLMILEGDAFGKASVYSDNNRTSARKIEYNTETGSIQVIDADPFEIRR